MGKRIIPGRGNTTTEFVFRHWVVVAHEQKSESEWGTPNQMEKYYKKGLHYCVKLAQNTMEEQI